MNYQMFLWLGGMAISIISYFLKNTMEELKYYKSMTIETKNKLDILTRIRNTPVIRFVIRIANI